MILDNKISIAAMVNTGKKRQSLVVMEEVEPVKVKPYTKREKSVASVYRVGMFIS